MKKWGMTIIVVVFLLVILIGQVAAMDSTNYSLKWYTFMIPNGASNMVSSHYSLDVTTGQMAVGSGITSTNYKLQLGYWPGVILFFNNFLPITLK